VIFGEELATCLLLYVLLSKSPEETPNFSKTISKLDGV
jgi:hypothetical protein